MLSAIAGTRAFPNTLEKLIHNVGGKSSEEVEEKKDEDEPAEGANIDKPPEMTTEQRIKNLENLVGRYHLQVIYTEKRLADLENQMQLMEYRHSLASENGRLIWPISNFKQRMQEARRD
uniref:Uncharacterized protein n=1 Tax=Anopheles culicifacies TaxID=139723 RepID=A0A182LXS8_9DIPT